MNSFKSLENGKIIITTDYKRYYESPKKMDRLTRSTSKKKAEGKGNNYKSVSIPKNNLNNYQGSININVNNLIINNPKGYDAYIPGQSMFSKLGNDIIKTNTQIKPTQNYKFNVNNIISNNRGVSKNSLVNNVINNLLEKEKEKGVNVNYGIVSKDPFSIDIQKNDSIDQAFNKLNINSQNLYEEFNTQNYMNANSEDFSRHAGIWENLIDLELAADNKNSLSIATKKLLSTLCDEISNRNLNFDIFSNTHLNKIYSKITKLYLISVIYLKFILLDFNYEHHIKVNVKKVINSLSEQWLNLFDSFILNKENMSADKIGKEIMEKYSKLSKIHKIKKNSGNLLSTSNISSLNKNLEITINTIKQFSNNFFKIGYFKPIHTICFDLFRVIDTISMVGLASMISRNILFYLLHTESTIPEKKGSSVKSFAFNSVFLGMGIGSVSPPFIPSNSSDGYTLVLDLDETLVHFFFTPSGGTFLIRPGAHEFLQEMSQLYEIVIFTAAMKDYADGILDILDTNQTIRHRLYRHHTSITGMGIVKDISKLGRDLQKVIIIDNIAENFKLQPNNGFFIKTWNEDMKDTQLIDLAKILKDIVNYKIVDVRIVIKKIKEEVNKKLKKSSFSPYNTIDISKLV